MRNMLMEDINETERNPMRNSYTLLFLKSLQILPSDWFHHLLA